MVHGIHHWNYLRFNVYLFNDIHVDLSVDVFSYKAKTSLNMDGHGSINCMWVLHILIESPTYIQLIVFRRIGNLFFCIKLNSHKIIFHL
jgi:hypothetical protein